MSAQAERVYTVDRIIIPEFHITLHNTTYTRKSNETQIFDNQWKNKQKISFNYDLAGKQVGYSVVNWNSSLNTWTDSMYCMFFYNSLEQPTAYQVSSVHGDTVDHVIYKEYYSYNSTTNKLEKMMTFSKNSADSLVLSSEEEYKYSQITELDSVITFNYDEDDGYVWSTIREKVLYVSDTVYSISENTSYVPIPDSPAVVFDIEHQYYFSADGKMSMQGKCLVTGILTERTLYSYRTEDGLPETDLSQNIASFVDKTYKDTSRIAYSFSFQDQQIIKTATTEILSSGSWIPVSRKIDTYTSGKVIVQRNSPVTADRDYGIKMHLSHSSNPSLIISSPEIISSIELFSINGALLHKQKNIQSGNEIRIDMPQRKFSDCSIPLIVKIQLENGLSFTRRFFQVR
jgi:hypothetical protein